MDELNNLTTEIQKRTLPNDEVIDSVLGLLVLSYVFGNKAANQDLSTDYEIDTEKLEQACYKKVADKNFEDRLKEYLSDTDENGNLTDKAIEEINRVIETDSVRVYNTGLFDVAEESGANKTWVTVGDERVRDTHNFIDGVTVPFNEKFYTYDGDGALYPGDFELASNNCGCRCHIVLSKANE